MIAIQRPERGEYDTHYQRYIDLVGEGNFPDLLKANTAEAVRFFDSIPESKYPFRYEANKWTTKDVVMHMIDTERGFSYRAIICVRGDDKTPLYPMDENIFASNVDVSNRTMKDLIEEFLVVRKSFQMIFENISDAQSRFLGNGMDHKISGRALGYIAIGHVIHHINVIKEKYL